MSPVETAAGVTGCRGWFWGLFGGGGGGGCGGAGWCELWVRVCVGRRERRWGGTFEGGGRFLLFGVGVGNEAFGLWEEAGDLRAFEGGPWSVVALPL